MTSVASAWACPLYTPMELGPNARVQSPLGAKWKAVGCNEKLGQTVNPWILLCSIQTTRCHVSIECTRCSFHTPGAECHIMCGRAVRSAHLRAPRQTSSAPARPVLGDERSLPHCRGRPHQKCSAGGWAVRARIRSRRPRPSQLLQAIRKRRPGEAERRTKRLEGLRSEKCLADDQERPRIRNDVEGTRNRTIPFTSRNAGLALDRRRCRSGRSLRCLNLGGGGHQTISLRGQQRAGRFESCARLTHHRN